MKIKTALSFIALISLIACNNSNRSTILGDESFRKEIYSEILNNHTYIKELMDSMMNNEHGKMMIHHDTAFMNRMI
ncbi:MAG: hypothetical protein ABIR06_22565 [Cyclobacteriaceae bacterium]